MHIPWVRPDTLNSDGYLLHQNLFRLLMDKQGNWNNIREAELDLCTKLSPSKVAAHRKHVHTKYIFN